MKPSEDNLPSANPPPPKPIENNVAAGGLAVVNKRMITWGADGVPVPTSVPLISKQNIEELALVSLALPYTGDALGMVEEEFKGMSNAEVMLVKLARSAAGGSMAAVEVLLDRVLGRPKQSVESKSFRMTYEDLLKEKAAAAKRSEVVEVQVVPRREEDIKYFGDGLDGLI